MDFSKNLEGVQVGDRVWHCEYKDGIVVSNSHSQSKPILANFPLMTGGSFAFTANGFDRAEDGMPSLFFAPIEFEIPKRPKPKVKKWRAAIWTSWGLTLSYTEHESKEQAKAYWGDQFIALIPQTEREE